MPAFSIERFQLLFIQLAPFLMAIVVHEFGHAFIARKFGDTTAEDLGRLTLNPVPHIDPVGTLLFPALNMLTGLNILFGWAKPVPINYNRLKPYRKGLFLVAFAGPMANMIVGTLASLALILFVTYVPQEFYLFVPLREMASAAISINFALAVFNLIPLPPLDGSRMVESFLSYDATRKFERLQNYSFFILLAMLWSGALNFLAIPIEILRQLTLGGWATLLTKIGILH